MRSTKPTVLFLCADNSIRSQLAEALLEHQAGQYFACHSAGLVPKPVHPMVLEALREVGVERTAPTSKPIGPFLGRGVRWAIILRSADETHAPRIFPFATRTWCWDVPDPGCDGRAPDEALHAIRRTRDDVDARLVDWLAGLDDAAWRSSAA